MMATSDEDAFERSRPVRDGDLIQQEAVGLFLTKHAQEILHTKTWPCYIYFFLLPTASTSQLEPVKKTRQLIHSYRTPPTHTLLLCPSFWSWESSHPTIYIVTSQLYQLSALCCDIRVKIYRIKQNMAQCFQSLTSRYPLQICKKNKQNWIHVSIWGSGSLKIKKKSQTCDLSD